MDSYHGWCAGFTTNPSLMLQCTDASRVALGSLTRSPARSACGGIEMPKRSKISSFSIVRAVSLEVHTHIVDCASPPSQPPPRLKSHCRHEDHRRHQVINAVAEGDHLDIDIDIDIDREAHHLTQKQRKHRKETNIQLTGASTAARWLRVYSYT